MERGRLWRGRENAWWGGGSRGVGRMPDGEGVDCGGGFIELEDW